MPKLTYLLQGSLLVLVEPGDWALGSLASLQQALEAFVARAPLALTAEWLGGSPLTSSASACAVGGCVLSAAELDSSKQYLLQRVISPGPEGDRWVIAYQLPVADGLLQAGDVGLRVDYGEDSAGTGEVQTVFRRHTRLWKADLGPLEPSHSCSSPGPSEGRTEED